MFILNGLVNLVNDCLRSQSSRKFSQLHTFNLNVSHRTERNNQPHYCRHIHKKQGQGEEEI
jgi:hypothetical protein